MTVGIKFLGVLFGSLIFTTSSQASLGVPDKCRDIIKKGLRVVRATEKNPQDFLNLGWNPKDIVRFAFPELDDVRLVRPRPDHYESRTVSSLVSLQQALRELDRLAAEQFKTKIYKREPLDVASEIVYQKLEQYLRNIGVETYTEKDDGYGQPFSYVSIHGKHPLNRWARALLFERNMHVVFYDTRFRIAGEFLHIPPNIFAGPNPVTTALTKMSTLLAQSNDTPIVYLEPGSADQRAKFQSPDGRYHILDWEDLLNQTVRVNYRPAKNTPDPLSESLQIIQSVHSLRGYLSKFPEDMRESVRKSLNHHAKSGEPLAFVAVEINGVWMDLWPKEWGVPHLSKVKKYLDHLIGALKDERMQRQFMYESELKFHVVVGTSDVEPVHQGDLELFRQLGNRVANDAIVRKKRVLPPKVSVDFIKIALLNHGLVVFEPLPPTLTHE